MKKLYLLCCFWAVAAAAQSISPKDVVGKWKVVTIVTPELSVDLATMEVTFNPETLEWAKKKNKGTDGIKNEALENAKNFVNINYSFTAKGIFSEKNGTKKAAEAEYELTNSNGQNMLVLYYPDEDYEDLYYISYNGKAKQLSLEFDEAPVTLLCEKIE